MTALLAIALTFKVWYKHKTSRVCWFACLKSQKILKTYFPKSGFPSQSNPDNLDNLGFPNIPPKRTVSKLWDWAHVQLCEVMVWTLERIILDTRSLMQVRSLESRMRNVYAFSTLPRYFTGSVSREKRAKHTWLAKLTIEAARIKQTWRATLMTLSV